MLPATRQRWESRLYRQPKQVLYLATPEGCKAELIYVVWKPPAGIWTRDLYIASPTLYRWATMQHKSRMCCFLSQFTLSQRLLADSNVYLLLINIECRSTEQPVLWWQPKDNTWVLMKRSSVLGKQWTACSQRFQLLHPSPLLLMAGQNEAHVISV